MRTPTKKRKPPIKETKSVSVSTTSTPVKTSPKARRSLKLSDVEDTVVKGEKEKKTQKKKIVPQASPTMERAGSTRTTPKRAAATDARKKFEQQQRNGGFES